MKFYETHFEEYITENKKHDLHPSLERVYQNFPPLIQNLKNVIIYGPSGIGKYTQLLKCIKKYSPSELKYEKKISILFNKQPYFLKISDIHYEVDMSLLGCNSKLLWHEIYQQIVDVISTKPEKYGIIVCKYFHEIHNELLDNFYSYMQQNYSNSVRITFFILSESVSFIPDNILNCCEMIQMSRPTKTLYNSCLKTKLNKQVKTDSITSIKNLYVQNDNLMMKHKLLCNKIIQMMVDIKGLNFLSFRDLLYDIFIYNLDINDCVWYILSNIVEKNTITKEDFTDVIFKTYSFFQYYNNNYRPIYHLENYLLHLVKLIHRLPDIQK